MAGPNKTYPSIRGLVGLSLHLSNTTAAKRLENISKNKVTVPRGANNYSSVRKKKNEQIAQLCLRGFDIFIYLSIFIFWGCRKGLFLLKEDVRKFMFRWDICRKRRKNLERTYCRTPLWSACVTP